MTAASGAVLVDTARSPHARLRPVPLGHVSLEDDFWAPRRRRNREVTLPSQYRRCEETGRIDNFRRAAGKIGGAFQGRYYNDSDVYKWLEACAYALATGPDAELERLSGLVIGEVAAAQEPDGYLNTHFTGPRAGERWTNLRDLHELYCAGHLIQAAVADRRCTGREVLLGVALRLADHVCETFGPGAREGTCGHQEIEMALVELARLVRDDGPRAARYLRQAELFIERRGRTPPVIGGSAYHQDHAPFAALEGPVGHAVRMLYYCCGAADVTAETGNPAYAAALERLWTRMTERRLYVTGGAGARYEGEAFGADWELPNDRAYAESCAAIASVMWNWRMLQATAEARFADLMETTLYNAVLPSLSLAGEEYFYQNPLVDAGSHRRQPWFECACCPPNIARLLASLPGYFYSTDAEGAWVHLYAAGTARLAVPGGAVSLTVETRYPWDGGVDLRLEPDAPGVFSLRLRVPAWAAGARAAVNGQPLPAEPGAYLAVRREWRSGDRVRLDLPLPPRRVRCHPRVAANLGRVALLRGPLVYCIEAADLDGADPADLVLPAEAPLQAAWEPGLLGGVTVLRGAARLEPAGPAWEGRLYGEGEPRQPGRAVELQAVPYFAWANREPGGMAVWLREA